MDELPVSSTYTALTAECPLAFLSLSHSLSLWLRLLRATGTWNNPCWWEDACFIADMLSVVLRLERRRSGSHTHIGTEKSHLVPLTCQLEAAKQMALMREAGIIQYSTLLTFTCGATRQAIDSALAWLFTHSPEERRSERQKWGRMDVRKARRLINVTLVYSDRGLWGEWRQDSYTKIPSCLLLVCAWQNFTGKEQQFSRCRPSQLID